ncbi:NUDIX domain-containing protein [Planosporangium flavigriseum]|nr:NUDIX hydrolase [Planosporangium flavigriseum]
MPASDYTATLPRKRMGSAALLRDRDGRILLVEPTYKDYWELPGGAVDGDESPYDAVARELKEELGLALTLGRLLVVDWVPPRAGHTEGVMFVFDGGVLDEATTNAIRLPADELRGWAWSTLAEARQRLSPLLARRAVVATEAVSSGGTVYLEDGNRIV